MLRIVFTVALVLVLATGCASSGLDGLRQFTRADVQRAHEIAAAANDVAGVNCAQAILDAMPEVAAPELHAAGAFSAFMKVRELRRRVSRGIDEDVHNACAPLVLDAQKTILKLGLSATPGGGVLGGLIR